jgi:hypothetical protein
VADTRQHQPADSGALTRRSFFTRIVGGIHGAALTYLLDRDLREAAAADHRPLQDLRPRPPHFPPRARAVIHLFMNGGPSQMDLFDPKPELDRRHGQPYFDRIAGETENIGSAGALRRPAITP